MSGLHLALAALAACRLAVWRSLLSTRSWSRGWTLIEMLIVVALIGTIMLLTTPPLIALLQNAKVERAIRDIEAIQFEIRIYEDTYDQLPIDLGQLRPALPIDPWGNAYQYLPYIGKGWKGKARLDQFLVPINTTYDLYSMGPDGETAKPLNSPASFDDIIRAADGSFIGPASKF
jgi:general secretion pathway protein G